MLSIDIRETIGTDNLCYVVGPFVEYTLFNINCRTACSVVGFHVPLLSQFRKTTIIRMLVGLLTSNDGTILIQGLDITKDIISAKMKLSIVPETGNVYTDLSTRENIQLVGKGM
ncbi:hypothetical protein [Methanohalobium sp.]|uniref:hypothetical protein n=1 Tax=Methanohalobium sp. TaxID=2837493 RepID=UPI0025FD68EB|nr:hypothetical protein [Methanohalobium sp.]